MKNIKILAVVLAAALFIIPATAMAGSKFSFSLNLDSRVHELYCPPPVVYSPPVVEHHVFVTPTPPGPMVREYYHFGYPCAPSFGGYFRFAH